MAFEQWLDADADPCNWYWINLTLDDTVGVLVLFALLRLLQCTYRVRCVNRPELARSGEYGDPPDSKIFARQLLDWQGLVVLQKIILAIFVVNFTSELTAVADTLLGWLDAHPKAKLVVVMVITPLTMNVFALWTADHFLQGDPEKSRSEEAQARESLVRARDRYARPRVLGQRTRKPLRRPEEQEELSGDEPDRLPTFQEWKQSTAARASRHPRSTSIPSAEPGEPGSAHV